MGVLELSFFVLLFFVSFLYASVGHGGASGYLALMTLFSFAPETMRSSALILNSIVSLIAFIQYYQSGYFQWKLFFPFSISSIPAAFIGGMWDIETGIYKKILAILLIFSALRFIFFQNKTEGLIKKQNLSLSVLLGAVIGLFSGMIGIGGGIILSPVILLLHWANMKQTAAVSALFIFVNSLAGMSGLYVKGFIYSQETTLFIFIAISGGFLGAYFGAKKLKSYPLQVILALVLVIASFKLFLT